MHTHFTGKFKTLLLFLLTQFFVVAQLCAQQIDDKEKTSYREQFLDAHKYLRQGQTSKARAGLSQLKAYPLAPYLELELLRTEFYSAPPAKIEAFIEREKDNYVGEKARLLWLDVLSMRNHYQDFIRHYQLAGASASASVKTRCQYARTLIKNRRQRVCVRAGTASVVIWKVPTRRL